MMTFSSLTSAPQDLLLPRFMNIAFGNKCSPLQLKNKTKTKQFEDLFMFCSHSEIHDTFQSLLSSYNIPAADYYIQHNLLDFQRVVFFLFECREFSLHPIGRNSARGRLKSNEKAALSSQKTLNKQDEVIGTTACAASVMMAPLIGLQLTQLQPAPLIFHCSHFFLNTDGFPLFYEVRNIVFWS